MDFGVSYDYMPETAGFDQIFGGGEGGGGSWDMPRYQAPAFNWDDPEYGGYVGGQGGMNVGGYQPFDMGQPQPAPGETSIPGSPVQQPGPQVGQPSGSSAQTEDESLWKKFRGGLDKAATAVKPETPGTKMLAGLGMAVAPQAIGAIGSGISSAMAKKSSSGGSSRPGATYQALPPEPLPGTKASPLLSGGPKKTNISQGLEERMRRGGSTGGFALY